MKWFITLVLLLLPGFAFAQTATSPATTQAMNLVHHTHSAAWAVTEPHATVKFQLPIADLAKDTDLAKAHGVLHVTIQSRTVGDDVIRVVTVKSNDFRLGQTHLGTLQGRIITPTPGAPSWATLSLTGEALTLEVRLRALIEVDFSKRSLAVLPGDITGAIKAHFPDLLQLRHEFQSPATQGELRVVGSINGTTDAPEIDLELGATGLHWNYEAVGDLSATIRHQNKVSSIDAKLTEAGLKWLAIQGTVPLDVDVIRRDVSWRESDPLDLSLRAANLTSRRMRPWFNTPRDVRFTMDGTATAKGKLAALQVDGQLTGWVDSNGFNRPLVMKVAGMNGNQRIQVDWGDTEAGQGIAKLDLGTGVDWVDWRTNGFPLGSTIVGSAKIDLPITALEPMLPSIGAPQGVVTADLSFGGTFDAPTINGNLRTEDAAITLLELNRRLTDLRSEVEFAGQSINFALAAAARPGRVSGQGKIDFGIPWTVKGEVDLKFEQFPIVRADFPVALAESNTKVTWLTEGDVTKASVVLSDTSIQLTEETLPETSQLPVNANIHFVDGDGDAEASLLAGAGTLDFTIDATQGIRLKGANTEVTVTDLLKLNRVGSIVRTDGGLSTESGSTFEMFGHMFEVRQGLVTLAPGNTKRVIPVSGDGLKEAEPLAPVIEMVAQSVVEGTHVMVKLNGSLSRPELVLMSFPPLPEYQIITLLVTGRVDAVDDRDGDVRRAVAKLVERYHNPSLERQLFDRIGVDKVGFGFGSSVANPILTVGKQLNRDLYIETVYRHDAPPDENMMEARVEQRLGRHWTVDTTFGEAAEGRAGVFWATTWGAPPVAAPSPDVWTLKNPSRATMDDDKDGVPNPFDLCPGSMEDPDDFEDDDGCPENDNDRDGIPDAKDLAPNQAEVYNGVDDDDGKPDQGPTELQNFVGTAQTYRFERRSAALPRSTRDELVAFAEVTRAFPLTQIVVVGHSDAVGSDARNLRVSQQRAESMRRFLIQAGVDRNRIMLEAKGATELLDPADNDAAHQKNRRVEVKLVYITEEASD